MSLWSERSILDRCFELRKYGEIFPPEPGSRVARGFADVGYEEFCVLSAEKLVSLFTGQASTPGPAEKDFYFVVPSVDMVREEIDRRGWDVAAVESPQQRGWVVKAQHAQSGRSLEAGSRTLLETFLDLLLQIVRIAE